MASKTSIEVIIIGAGSTGLFLAQGLKQNNIKCTVYERETASTYQTRPREWGMTLHWGAEYLSTCLPPDVHANLEMEVCCDPFLREKVTFLPVYNNATGEKLFNVYGMDPKRVSRRKLRNYLRKGIDVQYGKDISSISSEDGRVTATFKDGTTATGTLIVGCDGVNSSVRRLLVGEEAAKNTYMDVQMLNVSCRFPAETAEYLRSIHPMFKTSYHPDGFHWWNSIQDVHDPHKPETWSFQNLLSWSGAPRAEDLPTQESRIRFWRERGPKAAEPFRTIAAQLPDDLVFPVDGTAVWKPDTDWSSSPLWPHVTIAGDAAHAIPPFRGQGLNNALQDAAGLVDWLAEATGVADLKEAVAGYEKEMKERTLKELEVSILQAETVHDWERLMEAPFVKHGMNKYKEEQEEEAKLS